MLAIRTEIDAIARGRLRSTPSPLRHAPHTAEDLLDDWSAALHTGGGGVPRPASLRTDKYFPPVSRIDGAYGDRNLICSCEPLEAYAAES